MLVAVMHWNGKEHKFSMLSKVADNRRIYIITGHGSRYGWWIIGYENLYPLWPYLLEYILTYKIDMSVPEETS